MMFRVILIGVIALTYMSVYAQQKEISNSNTEEHIQLPGTKFALIPPNSNYVSSDQATGLLYAEKETGISITEMPLPYDDVLNMFSADMPKEEGALLKDEKLTMNGLNTQIFKTKSNQPSSFGSTDTKEVIMWVMIHGDSKNSVVVVSAYDTSHDANLSEITEKSFKSFLILNDVEVDPRDQLSFKLDSDKTDLQFAEVVMQSGVIYTLDGVSPLANMMADDAEEKKEKQSAVFMVLPLPFEIEKSERVEKSLASVKRRNPNLQIKSQKKVVVDGLDGYEIIGYDDSKGELKNLVYAVTLFDTDKHYKIDGSANLDLEKFLAQFQDLTMSFKVKK